MWWSSCVACSVCDRCRAVAETLSLVELHDIVLPLEPPLWPPPASFWVLMPLVAMLLWSAWLLGRRLRGRSAYRRAGLAALGPARSVHDVSVVLKRVALSAWPRAEVAGLHGGAWVAFLNVHCRSSRFPDDAFAQPAAPADAALREAAARWICRHRVAGGARSRL